MAEQQEVAAQSKSSLAKYASFFNSILHIKFNKIYVQFKNGSCVPKQNVQFKTFKRFFFVIFSKIVQKKIHPFKTLNIQKTMFFITIKCNNHFYDFKNNID